MDIFSPAHLPGVGMGDLTSIAAICGLIGLAVTSGAMIAEGIIGTLVFVVSAIALLQQKDEFAGGAAPYAIGMLVLLVVLTGIAIVLEQRARATSVGLAGAAADTPETKAARRTIARSELWAQVLTIVAVAIGGAAVGFAWAEWNEAPFRLEDTEAFVGLAIGVVAGLVGGDAAWRFAHGAIRAGGSAVIIGVAVVVVAFVANVASEYVPFVGVLTLLVAGWLALRLRRRSSEKYAGLRILS
jgi:hypothetical protein